jgi:hypothetical protein
MVRVGQESLIEDLGEHIGAPLGKGVERQVGLVGRPQASNSILFGKHRGWVGAQARTFVQHMIELVARFQERGSPSSFPLGRLKPPLQHVLKCNYEAAPNLTPFRSPQSFDLLGEVVPVETGAAS